MGVNRSTIWQKTKFLITYIMKNQSNLEIYSLMAMLATGIIGMAALVDNQ